MEESRNQHQNNIKRICEKLQSCISTQQEQIRHNTDVFNETLTAIKNNEKLNLIQKLLAQNEELVNKKRELELQ